MDTDKLEKYSEEFVEATKGIKEAQESEAKFKKRRTFLSTELLPSLTDGMGKTMELKSGSTLVRGMKYKGFFPSIGHETRKVAIDYFISKGYGPDLDGKLTLEFDGDERCLILKLLNFLIDLSKDSDYLSTHDAADLSPLLRSFYMAEQVQFARLNSRLGDLYENEEDFDPQLFGFQAVETINVKKGK